MPSASFFEGASDIQISGQPVFQNVVAERGARQVNHFGDTHNKDSNNKTTTVIKDSYNNNSKHITGGGARTQKLVDEIVESAARTVKERVNRPSRLADQDAYYSEPEIRTAKSRTRSPSEAGRPAPSHTNTAPLERTQPVAATPTISHPPNVTAYLDVPVQPARSANPSTTSLTQSVATSQGIAPASPSLDLQRSASAPTPAKLVSPFGSALTAPSVQKLSASVGRVDWSVRYRELVGQDDTKDEIRRVLINVAQSVRQDKFFILKEQATRASRIMELIEGSKEKVQSKDDVARLCLESHAVAFVTIMAAEEQTPDEKKIYNLLTILNKVEKLMDDVVHKNGLSRLHPLDKRENEKLVKSYRNELVLWLQDFKNDKSMKIDFALHKASKALSEALFLQQQYAINIAVQPPPEQASSNASPVPPSFQSQRPASPGSTRVSNISEAAVSVGSGSASVVNGNGSAGLPAQRAPRASPAPSNSSRQPSTLSPGSTSISGVSRAAVALGSGNAAVINAEGSGNNEIHQNSHNNESINFYR